MKTSVAFIPILCNIAKFITVSGGRCESCSNENVCFVMMCTLELKSQSAENIVRYESKSPSRTRFSISISTMTLQTCSKISKIFEKTSKKFSRHCSSVSKSKKRRGNPTYLVINGGNGWTAIVKPKVLTPRRNPYLHQIPHRKPGVLLQWKDN